MANQFQDSDATRIMQAITGKAQRQLKNGARTMTTWGKVAGISGGEASAYLYDAVTQGYEASEGFRIPGSLAAVLHVNDMVKVAIDYETSERWVLEVAPKSGDVYPRIALDIKTGAIFTGDGTVQPATAYSPSVPDPLTVANLTVTVLGTFNDLTITDDLIIGDDVTLASGSVLTWATDVNLYRSGADILATDDDLYVGSPATAANSGIHLRRGGSMEIVSNASTPYIDFKNDATEDFDARIIYNLSSDNSLYLYGTANGFAIKTTNLLRFGGTSFPASPSTDDLFYRTDLDEWYSYNGTAWAPGSKNPASRAYSRSRWR